MSEGINEKEEKILQQLINNKDIFYFEDDFNNVIRPLVGKVYDLYQKEKEKNRQSKMRIVQLEKEIDARIEDVNKYFISKDKIREKIEYYKKIDNAVGITILLKLLEENNGE